MSKIWTFLIVSAPTVTVTSLFVRGYGGNVAVQDVRVMCCGGSGWTARRRRDSRTDCKHHWLNTTANWFDSNLFDIDCSFREHYTHRTHSFTGCRSRRSERTWNKKEKITAQRTGRIKKIQSSSSGAFIIAISAFFFIIHFIGKIITLLTLMILKTLIIQILIFLHDGLSFDKDCEED